MKPARVQFAFLALLLIAAAQVLWWVYDQSAYSRQLQDDLLHAYESERAAAQYLLESRQLRADELATAAWLQQLRQRFPHLEIDGGVVEISDAAVEALEQERRSHVNQYRWEGAFFLLVLLAGIGIIQRALARERELRLRQENFLAAVSHELKSPLASLRLALETMVRRHLSAERRDQLVQRNLGDVDRLEDLVSKLLDTSRVEAARAPSTSQTFRLLPLAGQVVAELEPSAARNPTFALEISDDLELTADPVAVETVLRNLMVNARAAVETRDDRSTPGRVEVRAHQDGRRTTIEVVDNGVGFETAEGPKLFEKFYRPGDELRRTTRGTGLGLYLVRRFVELEGGTVQAESAGPGQGATFRVRL